jgi:hypothetical protein
MLLSVKGDGQKRRNEASEALRNVLVVGAGRPGRLRRPPWPAVGGRRGTPARGARRGAPCRERGRLSVEAANRVAVCVPGGASSRPGCTGCSARSWRAWTARPPGRERARRGRVVTGGGAARPGRRAPGGRGPGARPPGPGPLRRRGGPGRGRGPPAPPAVPGCESAPFWLMPLPHPSPPAAPGHPLSMTPRRGASPRTAGRWELLRAACPPRRPGGAPPRRMADDAARTGTPRGVPLGRWRPRRLRAGVRSSCSLTPLRLHGAAQRRDEAPGRRDPTRGRHPASVHDLCQDRPGGCRMPRGAAGGP